MFLVDTQKLWTDYKYYIVAGAILLVLLIVIVVMSIVSSVKAKKKAKLVRKLETEFKPSETEVMSNEKEEVVVSSLEDNSNLEEPKEESFEEEAEEVDEKQTDDEDLVLKKETVEEDNLVETTENNTQVEQNQIEEDVKEDSQADESNLTDVNEDNSVKEDVEDMLEENKQVVRGKYQIMPDRDGYKYILKASNGQPLIDSESYSSLKGCKNAISRLKANIELAEVRIEQDKKGHFQFHVVRGTRTVAHSANYNSKSSAQNALNSFLKFVKSDKIEVIEQPESFVPERVDLTGEEINSETLGKIVISKEEDFYLFKLIANNGQTICMSTTYKNIVSLKRAISKFQDAVYTGNFYMTQDKYYNFQFKLYTAEKRLVLTGETFQTKETCISNIKSCYRFAKNAIIEDTTV